SNSFAWVNATSKVADEAYHRLNALGHAGYSALAVEFGEQAIGLNRSGMLLSVRRSDASAYAAVVKQAEQLKAFDYPTSWVGYRELSALEPHVDFPDDAEALYSLADPCLDAPMFARFLAGKLRDAGGAVFEGCAADTLHLSDDGEIRGVVTEQGTLICDKVLVAAGPSTPEVLGQLTGYEPYASRFPMNRVPGLLVTTPSTAPAQLVRHVLYCDMEEAVHVLPMPNGGLKIGADDTDGMVSDGAPSDAVKRDAALKLLGRVKRLIPSFAGEACIDECTIGIGVRPYPADGKTIAGPLPGADGLFVVATHSGVTLSPAVGSLMADLIVDGQCPEALKPFALERFQGFG
ncbi:MAG: FAD-binding oxidoreductase, partial [Chromatiales bacterium]|nr:FAD-binding oxidoreductase [Chromatiales bacterium]